MVPTFPVYSAYHQYGGGLGGILGGFLKKGLISLGKRSLKAGLDTLSDVSKGASLKESLANNAKAQMSQALAAVPATINKAIKVRANKRKAISNTPGKRKSQAGSDKKKRPAKKLKVVL